MKKQLFIVLTVLFLGFMLTGCASIDTVEFQKAAVSEGKYNTTGVFYSKTFFQERFMGKEIGYQFLTIGNLLQYKLEDYDKRTGARLESSSFEKLMGDFDVVSHFESQLKKNISGVKTLKIAFEKDPKNAARIINYFTADNEDGKPSNEKFNQGTCLIALKISYGLGVRQGSEQIGLRKYYRPFIRILGEAKIPESNKIIWKNNLIAFSNNRYLGSEADAAKIKKDEMIQSFKELTDEVINMLIKNLNGEKLGEQPVLQGINRADNSF